MPILLGILTNLLAPYWDTLKKQLAEKKITSLTIIHAPNLIGHPIGLGILVALGLFAIPQAPVFYLLWFLMVGIASLSLVLNIWGLLETQFFGAQVLKRFGFLTSTLAAALLLHEHITLQQMVALGLATLGIFCFALPKRAKGARLVWDHGVFYILLSLVIGGLSGVLYKLATFYTPDYATFLTGRFIGDLIAWSVVWIAGLLLISKKNPIKELGRYVHEPAGKIMLVGLSVSELIGSWLIYVLPVSTVAMLGTLTIPSAYLWSRHKYRERLTIRMWVGAVFSVVSVFLFICPII